MPGPKGFWRKTMPFGSGSRRWGLQAPKAARLERAFLIGLTAPRRDYGPGMSPAAINSVTAEGMHLRPTSGGTGRAWRSFAVW